MPRVRVPPFAVWGALLMSGLALAAGVAQLRGKPLAVLVQSAVASAHAMGVGGYAVFIAVQVVVAASGVLPAGLLGVAAGGAFGVGLGFALAATSTMTGALVSFWIARSVFRGHAERVMARHARMSNLDGLLKSEGWRLVCLLRLSPVMPFAATSYAFGLSSIGWRDYLLGTCAAMPALLGYVVIGSLARQSVADWTSGAGVLNLVGLAVGGAATLVLTVRLSALLKRAGFFARSARAADPLTEMSAR